MLAYRRILFGTISGSEKQKGVYPVIIIEITQHNFLLEF